MVSTILAIGSTLLLLGAAQQRAEALQRAEAERQRLVTGCTEYSWFRAQERESAKTKFNTNQFAPNGDLCIYRGDVEGVIWRTGDGQVSRPRSKPVAVLQANGEYWFHDGSSLQVTLWEEEGTGPGKELKMRALGLSFRNSYDEVGETLWRDKSRNEPSARTYREYERDGFQVVEADTDYGRITWWIDAERGWNPVRVTFEKDGSLLAESRTTLKNYDGVWYPASVAFFGGPNGYKNGAEPYEVITVHQAEFNAPDQPMVLTPTDIGVEAGMVVERIDASDRHVLDMWDGQKAVSQEEYDLRASRGEVQTGPTTLRERARLEAAEAMKAAGQMSRVVSAASQSVDLTQRKHLESEWEAYTRRFVEMYRLNDDQSQKAWSVLKQCQERANQYIAKNRAEFEKLEQRIGKLRGSQDAKEREALPALEMRYASLLEPIHQILEDQLKPRLEKLPTRAQRQAATQPAP